MKCITTFSKISGLKCNIDKTKVIPIGRLEEVDKICPDIKLEWGNDFTLLGFYIDNKLQNLKQNLGNINARVKNLINKWKKYYLTIYGRITIVKSLLLAQYIYNGSILDILDAEEMKKFKLI